MSHTLNIVALVFEKCTGSNMCEDLQSNKLKCYRRRYGCSGVGIGGNGDDCVSFSHKDYHSYTDHHIDCHHTDHHIDCHHTDHHTN